MRGSRRLRCRSPMAEASGGGLSGFGRRCGDGDRCCCRGDDGGKKTSGGTSSGAARNGLDTRRHGDSDSLSISSATDKDEVAPLLPSSGVEAADEEEVVENRGCLCAGMTAAATATSRTGSSPTPSHG